MKRLIFNLVILVSLALFAGNCSSESASSVSASGDTTAPPPPATPNLDYADDSGNSSTDNITNVSTGLTFTGTAESGSSVQLYSNGVAVGSPVTAYGSYSIDISLTADGVYSITAIATDSAGNMSQPSTGLSVTIDTTPPVAPDLPDLTTNSDSGISTTDNITNINAPAVNVTSTDTGRYYMYVDGANNGNYQTSLLSAFYPPNYTTTGAALSDGMHAITVAVADVAGNLSAQSATLNLTIDTVAPTTLAAPDLDALDDTGISNTDDITKNTTLTFLGTSEIESYVKLYINGGSGSSGLYSGTGTGVTTAGNYSFSLSLGGWGDGIHAISAEARDAAGNVSTMSPALSVTVDTITEVEPSAPDLADIDDSGINFTDNITNSTKNGLSIIFNGTGVPGTLVQLYRDGIAVGFPVNTNSTTGAWTAMIDPVDLPDGTYSMTAQTSDIAGNSSWFSAILMVTFDTAIATPSLPDLATVDDTGISSTDNITNLTTGLTISGTADIGDSVQLNVDGTASGTPVIAAGGSWTKDITLATQALPYSVTATATDIAGNSATSAPLSLTINSGAGPVTVPSVPDLFASDDTGASNTDNITNLTTALTFTGTGTVGSYVLLFKDGINIGPFATVDSLGNWSIDIDLPAGATYAISAKNVDIAGNAGSPSLGLNVTVDNTISISVPDLSAASDTGFSSTDNITALTSGLTISGTCTAGDTVQINVDSVPTGAPVICATTSWSTTLALATGATYAVTATGTDVAGNAMTTAALNITIDSTVPTITSAMTMDADGNGYIDHYKITFSVNMTDASFPGYVSNSLGNAQSAWLLSNYANPKLAHGTAAPEPDTIDDNIIYLKFSEGPVPDTGNKPDITTTANPMFTSLSNMLGQVLTGTVTEIDSAKPVLAQARSNSETSVIALYSEDVFAAAAETTANYSIGGLSVSSAVMQAGAGIDGYAVLLTTTPQTYGVDNYTLVVATSVITGLDNLVLVSPQNTALFSGFESLLRLVAIGGNGQITLTWTPPTGMTSYNLYWGTSPGVTIASATAAGRKIAGVTSGYVHSPLTNGTPYYYIVTGVSGTSESAPSREVKGIPAVYGNQFFYPSMTSGRAGHTATRLSDGKVLISGGFSISGTSISTAEIYDPVTKSFSVTAGNMVNERAFHTATLLPDGTVLITGGMISGVTYNKTAEIYDPATKTFSLSTGMMAAPRCWHSATLLSDGTVMITGGYNGNLYNSFSEIYDPATKTFSVTTNMATARASHTATLLVDGTVLIVGGENGAYIKTAEIYDPVAKTFSTTTGSMATTRVYHTATLLPDGTVLIAGGRSSAGAKNDAEIYDPATKVFSSASGNMTVARAYHNATLLANGTILITGGSPLPGIHTSTEIYDPITMIFSSNGSMITPRYEHQTTILIDNTVLITGGVSSYTMTTEYANASSEIYNPVSKTFSYRHMFTAKSGHTTSLLDNGKVLITGGMANPSTNISNVELYDPFTNGIIKAPAMSTVRSHHTATKLRDGRVLILGGLTGTGTVSSGEMYNSLTNVFEIGLVINMINTRSKHTATLLNNGKVFIVGGVNAGVLASTEIFDPATNVFTIAASLANGRYGHTATLLADGRVLIAGGSGSSTAEIYNPVTNTFSPPVNMASVRDGHSAILLPDGKVLISGGRNGLTYNVSSEIFDPATNQFSASANMATGRAFHSAVMLANGKVLMAGGTTTNNVVSASAEIYDPATNTYSALPATMNLERTNLSSVLLDNGKVFLSGGMNAANIYYSSYELFE